MKDIIITSNEVWGPIWFSKQHYANELARMGFRVFFVNSPAKWKLGNLLSSSFAVNKEKENLWSVSYQNRLPIRFLPSFMLWLNDRINTRLLNRKLSLGEEVLWWQFDPFRFVYLPSFKSNKRIYHVTDDFFEHKTDHLHAQKADLLVVTSYPHYERYLKDFSEKTIHIPHGISKDQIRCTDAQTSKPKVLLVGTMNEDYDLDLLEELVRVYPKVDLEIIGPLNFESKKQILKFNELKDFASVNYIGPVPHSELIHYIKTATVCISVYRYDMKRVLSSLKILDYLAACKPVVTTILQGFEDFEGKGVFHAKNREEFVQKVGDILEGKFQVDLSELEEFLSRRGYEKLIKTILENAHVSA